MKILIYGSTYLTQKVCCVLNKKYELVGYVPSSKPFIRGQMTIPEAGENVIHDIKLSIQYDKKIHNIDNAFNVHTGLLPEWGGCDILYHTLKKKSMEQGVTFHKMTHEIDYGPILSRMTYPVFEQDTVFTLYERLAAILPGFVLNALEVLENIGFEAANQCRMKKPQMYRRGSIPQEDQEAYKNMGKQLMDHFSFKNDFSA